MGQVFRKRVFQHILIAFLFCLSVWAAFFVRNYHYHREAGKISKAINYNFVPCLVESAIMWGYSRDVAEGRSIAGPDPHLLGMENQNVSEQMSLGLEYFLGYGFRLKQFLWPSSPPQDKEKRYDDNPAFTDWARFQLRLWASFATGFLFLWLIALRCPWYFAFFGSLLHAIAPAAVARYTGQEFVRGAFCLPLVVATLMLAAWFMRKPSNLKLVLFAVVAFLALATWDMCQIIFAIWGLVAIFRVLIGGVVNRKRRAFWSVFYATVVLAAVLIPYHRAHFLILSPLVMIILPVLVLAHWWPARKILVRVMRIAVPICIMVIIWQVLVSYGGFSENYGHFGELLKAKLKFMNVKPTDPRQLNFAARILWTPGMHSATWRIAGMFFPFTIWGTLLMGAFLAVSFGLFKPVRSSFRRYRGSLLLPFVLTVFYGAGFVFIVRYHVFLILFLAVLLPLLLQVVWHGVAGCWHQRKREALMPRVNALTSAALGGLMLLSATAILLIDSYACLFVLGRSYEGEYFPETVALVEWFKHGGPSKGQGVLADFMLSPMLKAYCGQSILLQPKFEMGKTRKNVETFINLLYHGTEEDLNRFCVDNNVKFFVYDLKYANPTMHPFSNRYFAAALSDDPKSPEFRMYHAPDKCRWFYRIEPPSSCKRSERKYRVFRVISPKDRLDSMKLTFAGQKALLEKNYQEAQKLAKQAFLADPYSDDAYKLYFEAFYKTPTAHLSDY